MSKKVPLPTELRLRVPLLVMVPCKTEEVLLGMVKLLPLEMVTVLVEPFRTAPLCPTIVPPELLVSVPPATVEPFSRTSEPVPVARMVPPVLVMLPSRTSSAPAVASRVPVLVVPPLPVPEALMARALAALLH